MTTVRIKPNIKLAKLWYKYMDEPKDHNEEKHENVEKQENVVKQENKDHESYAPYNFSWFVENKIAAMGWPQTVANLNYLVDVGVNHLVTLSSERVPPILECERKLKWTEIGIKEFGAPTLRQIIKFIDICERAELRGEVVGVHCRQGRGRTGTMLACYLVHFNHMAPERAVLTVRMQRPGSCETYEQEKMVCHYHDCLRGTIEKPDYNMVENKLYFDFAMKYMYDDDMYEGQGKKNDADGGQDNEFRANGGQDQEYGVKEKKDDDKSKIKKKGGEKKVRIKREKSNAMVINHKIYF